MQLSIDATANTVAATSADTTTCVVTVVADETTSLASKGDSHVIDWLGWGGLGLENPYWQHGLISDRGNYYVCLYFMIMNLLSRFTTKVFHSGFLQSKGWLERFMHYSLS